MREAGGQGGGRLNMMPTIIGKQDADDDDDDDTDGVRRKYLRRFYL